MAAIAIAITGACICRATNIDYHLDTPRRAFKLLQAAGPLAGRSTGCG